MSNRSIIVLDRVVSAEYVEQALREKEVRFFKKLVRGLRASRGTPDWIHDVQELQATALDPFYSLFFRSLALRYLTRLNTRPGELAKPNWAQIIAESAAAGENVD